MTLTHEAILTLAHKTEAAAEAGERDRVETAVLRLFEALVEHVDAEHESLSRLAPGEHRLLARGQQRIIDLLIDLAVVSQTNDCGECDQMAHQLVALLRLQADDERMEFARHQRHHSRSAAMTVTEPLRHEHADLLPHLADLDTVAAGLDAWGTGTPKRLRELVEFLHGHLVPHARAEEAALYPTVEDVMGAPGATDTMKADHVEIVRRIDEIAAASAAIGSGPPTASQAERLRAQLYGLSAILHLHFDKEEQVLLPILDAHLNANDAEQLFTKMRAVAHPHEGTPT